VRFTEDGEVSGVRLDGKVGFAGGAGLLVPVDDRVVGLAEARVESERFDGAGEDIRLLVGFNWHVLARGTLRAATSAGLADGAPDVQLLAGLAWEF
jgi:hypothetical protein